MCVCDEGYAAQSLTCANIDECALGLDDCSTSEQCIDLEGSYRCEPVVCQPELKHNLVGYPEDAIVVDDRLLMASGRAGLRIFAMHGTEAPTLLGQAPTIARAQQVRVSGRSGLRAHGQQQVVGRLGRASMARAVRAGWSDVPLEVRVLEERLPAAILDHSLKLEAWKLSCTPSVPVMVVGEHVSAGLHVAGAGSRDPAGVQGQEEVEAALGHGQLRGEVLLDEADEGLLPVPLARVHQFEHGLCPREEVPAHLAPIDVHDMLEEERAGHVNGRSRIKHGRFTRTPGAKRLEQRGALEVGRDHVLLVDDCYPSIVHTVAARPQSRDLPLGEQDINLRDARSLACVLGGAEPNLELQDRRVADGGHLDQLGLGYLALEAVADVDAGQVAERSA